MKAGDKIRLSRDERACGVLAGARGEITDAEPGRVRVFLEPTRATRWTGRDFWVDEEAVEVLEEGG